MIIEVSCIKLQACILRFGFYKLQIIVGHTYKICGAYFPFHITFKTHDILDFHNIDWIIIVIFDLL